MHILTRLCCICFIVYTSAVNAGTIHFTGYITSPGCKSSYSSQKAVLHCEDNVATPDKVNFNVEGKPKVNAPGVKVLIHKKDEKNTLVTVNYK